MNRSAQIKFSSKILEKTIKTSIKKAIASQGINVIAVEAKVKTDKSCKGVSRNAPTLNVLS